MDRVCGHPALKPPDLAHLPGPEMKILLCHNYYQQRGGEDAVFESEVELLRRYGHEVRTYTTHNDRIGRANLASTGLRSVYNGAAGREIVDLALGFGADIVHFHNTFPLISPAAFRAVKSAGIPVVATLHNFRPLCVNGILFRDGQKCFDCLGKSLPLDGIVHRCYRNSFVMSCTITLSNIIHRRLGTWNQSLDLTLVLSEEVMGKMYVESGFPAHKLFSKPNFLSSDPGTGDGAGGFALFVGRIEEEKGIRDLVAAWGQATSAPPLRVVGGGSLAHWLEKTIAARDNISYLGQKPLDQTLELIRDAAFLVFPSRWLEGMPRTIIESFACGTPVLASGHGTMLKMIEDKHNGCHFEPGSSDSLAEKVDWLAQNPGRLVEMRTHARRTFESHYTAAINHDLLMRAYEEAQRNHAADPPR